MGNAKWRDSAQDWLGSAGRGEREPLRRLRRRGVSARRSVALGITAIAVATTGLARVAEAMSGDGGTVYLANIQPGSSGSTAKPGIVVTGVGHATAPTEQSSPQLVVGGNEESFGDASRAAAGDHRREFDAKSRAVAQAGGLGITLGDQILASEPAITLPTDATGCPCPVREKCRDVISPTCDPVAVRSGAAAGDDRRSPGQSRLQRRWLSRIGGER